MKPFYQRFVIRMAREKEERSNKMYQEIYDIVVAGGGTAGISAALSAARQGADVLLVEKNASVGGTAAADS